MSASHICSHNQTKGVQILFEELLADYPNELKFYQELTPGYQVDWARYIFSAKQQKTRDKRQAQMVDVLSQGYKSFDLYRLQKK